MEFLYKLYDQQYFGIILFIVIAVLLLLFLIILFFGKKDEKRKLEETRKLELAQANNDTFKEVDGNTKELVIPEIEQPEIAKVEETVEPISEVRVEQTPVENIETPVEENTIEPKIDIDSLFELPEDNEVVLDNKVVEEPKVEFEPVQEVKTAPVEPPLSSVFVEPKKEEANPFDMPKLMDMPKLKEEETPKEESNNVFEEETVETNNIFDNIENETYKLK